MQVAAPGRSRRKGKDGENEVGKLLWKAWYGADPPRHREVFVRTKPGVRQRMGDLVVPPDFPFYVSIKNVISPLHHFFAGGKALGWWADAVVAADKASLSPMLIWKVARGTWWVAAFVDGRIEHTHLIGSKWCLKVMGIEGKSEGIPR